MCRTREQPISLTFEVIADSRADHTIDELLERNGDLFGTRTSNNQLRAAKSAGCRAVCVGIGAILTKLLRTPLHEFLISLRTRLRKTVLRLCCRRGSVTGKVIVYVFHLGLRTPHWYSSREMPMDKVRKQRSKNVGGLPLSCRHSRMISSSFPSTASGGGEPPRA